MENPPPAANQPPGEPQPEVLQTRGAESGSVPPPVTTPAKGSKAVPNQRRTYRPSHKATFIGLGVVAAILAVNVGVIGVVLKNQSKKEDLFNKGQVSISSSDLNRLGINRNVVGDSGVELIVAPDAQFKGKVTIAGATTVSGQLLLNSKLIGTEANLAVLQAGKTSLSDLNVNGDGTLSTLKLRKDLIVTGSSHLQGAVTLAQLLTVNNSVNVSGNLSVGGILNVNTFSVRTLNVNGHVITSGSAPSVARGSATGSNGSVSASGNDAAGTIAINIGAGATGGILVNLAFRTAYSGSPRVVISPVGIGGSFYLTNITVGGFSVGINSGLPPGGYRVNYIVEQ